MNKQTKEPAKHHGKEGSLIVVAGATGELGGRIVYHLVQSGASVRALIRKGSGGQKNDNLKTAGCETFEVNYDDHEALIFACRGASCVVSALSGLRDVIVGVQLKLLNAAVEAGVPRFIPSDFCIDYTKLPEGGNRNLDLRREFFLHVNKAPISATSVLNGMFTDLLKGTAPLVLFGIKRVMYYGDSDQSMDFTTLEDTAAYTALVALDSSTPRMLYVAGDVLNAKELAQSASAATGENFRLLRVGGLGLFSSLINVTRFFSPAKNEVFPAWQGMQYMHNMFSGKPKFKRLDNDRYLGIKWTSVLEVLKEKVAETK